MVMMTRFGIKITTNIGKTGRIWYMGLRMMGKFWLIWIILMGDFVDVSFFYGGIWCTHLGFDRYRVDSGNRDLIDRSLVDRSHGNCGKWDIDGSSKIDPYSNPPPLFFQLLLFWSCNFSYWFSSGIGNSNLLRSVSEI